MKIIVGKTSGFCYGVKRAVEGATSEIVNKKGPIYCLGELVHNRQVIKKLEDLGIKCIEKIQESNGVTIIRAHGVPKEVYKIAKEKNIVIKDYTCPNVLKVQKIAQKFSNNGYFIFLLGNKNHPENIGTLSYCKNYYVIENVEDIPNAINSFENSEINKLLLISQTTYSLEKFNKIEEILKEKISNNVSFVIKNTICKTTELRQKETQEISKKVDMMIIIGGKNSSNTKKLYEVSKKYCNNTIMIETAKELEIDNIDNNVNTIGIMAGASTPKESIDEVIKKIEKIEKIKK